MGLALFFWIYEFNIGKDTTFTLEADKVVFPYGQIAYVNSNTNFVSVNKDDAVVQVAFYVPFSGPKSELPCIREASVEILPNFNSRRLTLNGVILPLHKSTVFQGRTL